MIWGVVWCICLSYIVLTAFASVIKQSVKAHGASCFWCTCSSYMRMFSECFQVVFLKELQKFETINTSNFNIHRQHKIYFSTDSVQEAFSTLLQHKCPLCPDIKPFRSFDQLSVHMKRQHQLFYCELCVEHLKVWACQSWIFHFFIKPSCP